MIEAVPPRSRTLGDFARVGLGDVHGRFWWGLRRVVGLSAPAVVALACAPLGGCQLIADLGPRTHLTWGSGVDEVPGGFGLGLPVEAPGEPVSIGALVVCADRGSAQVVGMRFRSSEQVVLRGYSVRMLDTAVDAVMAAPKHTSLTEAGWPVEPELASGRCGQEKRLTELGVEVALESGSRGEAEGLVVSYRSGRRTDEVVIPFELVLCAADTCPP